MMPGHPADAALRQADLDVGEPHRDLRVQPVDRAVHAVRAEQHRGDLGRRVGRRRRRRSRRTDVQAHHRLGLRARREQRIPVAGVDRRQAELVGRLRERDRLEAARRVAADLVGREVGVAQVRDLVRDEAVGMRAAPRVEVPVVVRAHRGERELVVVGPHREPLADEAGQERREAQRRARRRRCPCRRRARCTSHAPRRISSKRVGSKPYSLDGRPTTALNPTFGSNCRCHSHASPPSSVGTTRGCVVGELLREAAGEHVGRLDDVVVDRDDRVHALARLGLRAGT